MLRPKMLISLRFNLHYLDSGELAHHLTVVLSFHFLFGKLPFHILEPDFSLAVPHPPHSVYGSPSCAGNIVFASEDTQEVPSQI